MEKDALCACKDDVALENVWFWQRRFLIRFRERSQLCFDFRVAYSDGLVSRLVEDRKNRTPVGIVVKGWLVLGKEAPRLMTWEEGLKYCANVKSTERGVSYVLKICVMKWLSGTEKLTAYCVIWDSNRLTIMNFIFVRKLCQIIGKWLVLFVSAGDGIIVQQKIR